MGRVKSCRCWKDGKLADARYEAELADDAADGCDGWDRGAVAVWLRRTGSARPPRGELAAPYRRLLGGDVAGAAPLLQNLGCPYEAGLAPLGSADETSLPERPQIFPHPGPPPPVRPPPPSTRPPRLPSTP